MVDTIKQTIIATEDSYVNMNQPAMNYGNALNLDIDYRAEYPSRWKRPHIYFPLDDIEHPELEIYTTIFGIYLYYCDGPHHYNKIYAAAEEWDEMGLTWNNKPDLGALSSVTIYTGGDAYPNWHYCNITDLVRAWVDGTYPNYGLIIEPDDSPDFTEANKFYSRHKLNYEPFLNIYYLLPAPEGYIGKSYIID